MKNFYYTQKLIKHSRKFGSSDYLLHIYTITNKHLLKFIGKLEYRTSGTRGPDNEVFAWLVDNKLIPLKYYKKSPYFSLGGANNRYNIVLIK